MHRRDDRHGRHIVDVPVGEGAFAQATNVTSTMSSKRVKITIPAHPSVVNFDAKDVVAGGEVDDRRVRVGCIGIPGQSEEGAYVSNPNPPPAPRKGPVWRPHSPHRVIRIVPCILAVNGKREGYGRRHAIYITNDRPGSTDTPSGKWRMFGRVAWDRYAGVDFQSMIQECPAKK